MRYAAPFGVSDANASYVNGDPSIGRQGSIPPAEAFENPQRELVNILLAAGINPDGSINTQVRDAISYLIQRDTFNYALDTGATNAAAITLTPPTLTLTPGLHVWARMLHSNTGAMTLNVDGHGAKSVVHADGTVLVAGDVLINEIAEYIYDSVADKWQLKGALQTGFGGPAGPAGSPGSAGAPGVGIYYGDDIGSANALVVNVGAPFPVPTSYFEGMLVGVKVAHNTTLTSVSINLNSLGAKFIKRTADVDMVAGDLLATGIYLLEYDGTFFQVVGGQLAGTVTPPGGGSAFHGVALFEGSRTIGQQTSTTWVVPPNVYGVKYRLWGGGGQNSGQDFPNPGNSSAVGAGGYGGYSEGVAAVTPGQIISITIGGSGGYISATPHNGGVTIFGTYAQATGGVADAGASQAACGVGSGGSINVNARHHLAGGASALPFYGAPLDDLQAISRSGVSAGPGAIKLDF